MFEQFFTNGDVKVLLAALQLVAEGTSLLVWSETVSSKGTMLVRVPGARSQQTLRLTPDGGGVVAVPADKGPYRPLTVTAKDLEHLLKRELIGSQQFRISLDWVSGAIAVAVVSVDGGNGKEVRYSPLSLLVHGAAPAPETSHPAA